METTKKTEKKNPGTILMIGAGIMLLAGYLMPMYKVVSSSSSILGTITSASYPLALYGNITIMAGIVVGCIGLGLYFYHHEKI